MIIIAEVILILKNTQDSYGRAMKKKQLKDWCFR